MSGADGAHIRSVVYDWYDNLLPEVRQSWRCHEFARHVAGHLNGLGFATRVCDGHASYQVKFFLSDTAESGSIEDVLFGRIDRERTIRYQHSWCVVNDDIIIDCHPSAKITPNVSVHQLVIYHEREKAGLGVLQLRSSARHIRLCGRQILIFLGFSLLCPFRVLRT